MNAHNNHQHEISRTQLCKCLGMGKLAPFLVTSFFRITTQQRYCRERGLWIIGSCTIEITSLRNSSILLGISILLGSLRIYSSIRPTAKWNTSTSETKMAIQMLVYLKIIVGPLHKFVSWKLNKVEYCRALLSIWYSLFFPFAFAYQLSTYMDKLLVRISTERQDLDHDTGDMSVHGNGGGLMVQLVRLRNKCKSRQWLVPFSGNIALKSIRRSFVTQCRKEDTVLYCSCKLKFSYICKSSAIIPRKVRNCRSSVYFGGKQWSSTTMPY
jgi:hypothetical protein